MLVLRSFLVLLFFLEQQILNKLIRCQFNRNNNIFCMSALVTPLIKPPLHDVIESEIHFFFYAIQVSGVMWFDPLFLFFCLTTLHSGPDCRDLYAQHGACPFLPSSIPEFFQLVLVFIPLSTLSWFSPFSFYSTLRWGKDTYIGKWLQAKLLLKRYCGGWEQHQVYQRGKKKLKVGECKCPPKHQTNSVCHVDFRIRASTAYATVPYGTARHFYLLRLRTAMAFLKPEPCWKHQLLQNSKCTAPL